MCRIQISLIVLRKCYSLDTRKGVLVPFIEIHVNLLRKFHFVVYAPFGTQPSTPNSHVFSAFLFMLIKTVVASEVIIYAQFKLRK